MLRMDSRACKAGAPVSKPLTTGRSKNVVLIAVNGGKKRQKEKKRRGKWLIRFCLNSPASFGLV